MIVIPLNDRKQPAYINGCFLRTGRYHCHINVDDVDEDNGVKMMLEVEGVRGLGDNAEWVWLGTDIEGAVIRWRGKDVALKCVETTKEIVWNDDIRDAMENEYQKDRELEMEVRQGIR